MKNAITIAFIISLASIASANVVTLTIDANARTNSVSIAANEVAQIKTYFDSVSVDGSAIIQVTKDGRSFSLNGSRFSNTSTVSRRDSVSIVGPATIAFLYSYTPTPPATAFVTIEITPESFPPGLTVILPEGTVGVIHVESSTNLVQWQDEWVQPFANTNQNRFFRIRAERSLP